MRPRVLLEPRGFTRLLQLIFASITISQLNSYDQNISININCKPKSNEFQPVNTDVLVPVKYPFSFSNIGYETCTSKNAKNSNSNSEIPKSSLSITTLDSASKSRYLMAMLALTIIFSLTLIIYYTIFELHILTTAVPGRKIDFFTSLSMTFLLLLAAILFSSATNNIVKNATPRELSTQIDECKDPTFDANFRTVCSHGKLIDKTGLYTVNCLNYINFLIWLFMIWFSYKEIKDADKKK